jgi:hypothetical protein
MTTPTKTTDPRPISVQLIEPEPGDRWTDFEELVADPLVERHAPRQSEKKTGRLLAILDELAQKGPAR